MFLLSKIEFKLRPKNLDKYLKQCKNPQLSGKNKIGILI